MKTKNLKPQKAALEAAGCSLQNIREEVSQKALGVELFKASADATAIAGSPWVRDLCCPDDDDDSDTWCAIISAPNGKTYEQDFTCAGGKVTFTGDPREVIAQVEYAPAPADASAKDIDKKLAELQAGDSPGHEFRGNQHADGKSAVAVQKSDDANAKSKIAIEKNDQVSHEAAADAHADAQAAHTRAAEKASIAGDQEAAKAHRAAASAHGQAAWLHNEKAAALKNKPAESTASSPAELQVGAANLPLEAASTVVDAPLTFKKGFMVMAGGVRTMTLGCKGSPLTVTVDVNAAGARALNQQLEAVNRCSKQRVFNCFDHEKKAASGWPQKIYWDPAMKAICEQAEGSKPGLEAVEGKSYRGFSLTFYTDAEITAVPAVRGGGFEIQAGAKGSPENPASIICPEDVEEKPEKYLNMGTLTNRPACADNEPLFAAQPPEKKLPAAAAAAHSKPTNNERTPMKKELDAAALQARNEQLETKIAELSAQDTAIAKAELRAAQAELEANQAKLELAAEQRTNTELKSQETKRVELAAQSAVEAMIEGQQIPVLDKELQAEWKDKFIKDPNLIKLVVSKPGGATARRVTTGAVKVALDASRRATGAEYGFNVGDAMKNFLEILTANASIRIHRGMSRGQLEAAYEDKGKLAMKAGLFYKHNLKKHESEWDCIPGTELAACLGLDASQIDKPSRQALEAGDYTDPNNQFGILNGTLVLQRTLPLFAYEYPELMAMYTDFSDAPGLLNQEETTHIVIVPAVQKYNTGLDANNRPIGFQVVSPAQTIDAPITLTDYIAVPIVIGNNILGSTQRRLFDEMAPAGIKAIAGYFTGMMSKLITPAAFNAYAAVSAPDANGVVTVPVAYATYAKGLTDWSMTDFDKLSAIFTQNKVPRAQRGILLSTPYYAKLRSDPRLALFFAAAKADPILMEQKLPPGLSGFFPYEAPYLPQTGNLAFFPFHKAGIMLKSRLPVDFTQALGVMIPGSVTTVTDPDSKMSNALVQRVDLVGNYAEWRPEVQLGAAVGDNRGGLAGTTQ